MSDWKLFRIQFLALCWKNWIVLTKSPFVSILRCFVLPLVYGIFLSFAQGFLHRLDNFGMGTPTPISTLQGKLEATKILWVDGTSKITDPTPAAIIAQITSNFSAKELSQVEKVDTLSDMLKKCPQNFDGFSQCFAGLSFTDTLVNGTISNSVNYTIFADVGLSYIDVVHHTSDFENHILPLQWAIDQAIIELRTQVPQSRPIEWPYTILTNEEQLINIRLSYIRGIRELIALAFFLTFGGISYQISGSVASERSILLTEHMKAMGLLDSARFLSWHFSISLTYLPAWIAIAVIWQMHIFTKTNVALVILVHVFLGLNLASWSFFIAAPFKKNPQLAAVVATFLGISFAILGLVIQTSQIWITVMFSILFPPSFYLFAIKAICGYENHQLSTDGLRGDPDNGLILVPILIAAATNSSIMIPKLNEKSEELPDNISISIRNLSKIYTGSYSVKNSVTAVSNLSLDIPKTGIFVMLGSNGAGKSTTMSILAGLSSITRGTVIFEGGYSRPPRGSLGIVPQKNVLFPDLTCLQTLKVWRAVKWSEFSEQADDLEQLLRDCDLEHQGNSNAARLSGGQKRKLQLAIGLLGGSKIVLVDECTSGVDPLSRRAIWKILSSFRLDRCIVFTTHFLDEADLLADQIAILASPGKIVASGSPIALKREFGEGFSAQVSFSFAKDPEQFLSSAINDILGSIKTVAPNTYVTVTSPLEVRYHLKTADNDVIGRVLGFLEAETRSRKISSYDVLGTTIEDVFLHSMMDHQNNKPFESIPSSLYSLSSTTVSKYDHSMLNSHTGRPVSPFQQALTIFHKRLLIARRSWLTPLITILIAVTGACTPLVFIKGSEQSCASQLNKIFPTPLFLPDSPALLAPTVGISPRVVTFPPDILSALGKMPNSFQITQVLDNATFFSTISNSFQMLSTGGISVDMTTGASTIAWEATPPGLHGPAMLNFLSNILFNRALNSTGKSNAVPTHIAASYSSFPRVSASTLYYLKWLFMFGSAMAVYPAFFAIYVSQERMTLVQRMQLSNGLTNPIGLWLGHLMFDTIVSTLLSTIIIIVFATFSSQFHALPFLWVVLVLYGITGSLFAYCLSFLVSTPLAAFAIVASYQFVISVAYLSSYLLIFTFGKITDSSRLMTISHFTTSFVAPIGSLIRAALVSANLFALACDGTKVGGVGSQISIQKFGGPILYLISSGFVLMAILVWADSGSGLIGLRGSSVKFVPNPEGLDDDPLQICDVSKSFDKKEVIKDVSFSIPRDSIFALLGPNGAGKTTMFNIICGGVSLDKGDVIVNNTSILRNRRLACLGLGVCPQFTAIDSQLKVRDHLFIYGRLKGLKKGNELEQSIEAVLKGTSLDVYADRLASKLSGGNQRKLALAIALIGNPSVILVDEFSTGVDPKMKRDLWDTLRRVSPGKAIIITTHSMEEASALATGVAIMAKRILAIGTVNSLAESCGVYEVHFCSRTREDVIKARTIMKQIPGSRMKEDFATRFEVPIGDSFSLAELFIKLASHDRGSALEYTIEKASLESVFLNVVREEERRKNLKGSAESGWEA